MMAITADLLVDDVMQQWPATIRVFLDTRMHCVGCPIARFHTIADATREHGVDGGQFLAALSAAHETDGERTPPSRYDDRRPIAPSPLRGKKQTE